MYIYEQNGWPAFRWNDEVLMASLAEVRHRQGRLIGRMESLGFHLREEAMLGTLTEDVLKSCEIEGEHLDAEQVRSSVARRLGMDIAGLVPTDRDVEGVVEMMLDATQNYSEPLTKERLCSWHASLFPTGRNGMTTIKVADWRDDSTGPMEVVSGPIGRENVHFRAPSASVVASEMAAFLAWFAGEKSMDGVLAAAIAHLWFVTIHPFDDGNGRIARAIADMMLARSEASSQRFYSMSSQIRADRNNYYKVLESTQKGDLDVTNWLRWFISCLGGAIDRAEQALGTVLTKADFWDAVTDIELNERQRRVLNRVLDGFEGNLTSSKWAKLAKCSQDTATRDIDDLIEKGILSRGPAGGRSTSYEILWPEPS